MKLFKDNKKGFTFIELLIAISILSIVIPSFFTFLSGQIFKTKLSMDMTNALFLAEQKMEMLIQKSYNDSDLTDSNTSNNSNMNVAIDSNSVLENETSYMSSNFEHYDTPVTVNNNKFYTVWNIAEDSTIKTTNKFKKIGVIVYWIWQGESHKVF